MKRITSLLPHQVFVFGSNEAGIHGAGAARDAADFFGAIHGIGFGHYGQSFAIPTESVGLETLSLRRIKDYVELFLFYAAAHPEFEFVVTPIGCGLAGYKPADIAPLFSNIETQARVVLPEEFLISEAA